MQDSHFNIIVKKILKLKGKILDSVKLKKIIQDIMDGNYSDKKAYKIIYYLKQRWYIVSLKKDIFFVKEQNQQIDLNYLIDKFYRTILYEHCKEYLWKDRYIGWIKALEFNMSNYSIPEEIDIINTEKQSKEVVLASKYINFKTYSIKKGNLFKEYKKMTQKIKIGKNSFLISNIELAILESLYNPNAISENYVKELIKKILRKHKKTLKYEIFEKIIKSWKHHSSINRLYNLSKIIDPEISTSLLQIVKKYSFLLDVQ